MSDIIFGISDHLRLEDINAWARSIAKVSFRGKTVLFAYDVSPGFPSWCESRGISLIDLGPRPDLPKRVNKERWGHYADFIERHLKNNDRVIATDVRDLVFQLNPSIWLDAHPEYDLVTSLEGPIYEHELWNRDNAIAVYGQDFYERHLKKRHIVCGGLLAGRSLVMRDLFLEITKSVYQKPTNQSDQIILNGLLATLGESSSCAWKILATNPSHDFCVHGAVMSAPDLVVHCENGLAQVIDGAVCNPSGQPYVIIHQYDRMPSWRAVVERLGTP